MPTRSELLADIPLFSLLDDGERGALAGRLDDVRFQAGAMLFTTGDPGESMFVLVSGEVEVFFRNNTGQQVTLETVTAGHFIGEISLLDGGSRSASAIARTDVEAIVIDRGDLDEFLRACPAAALDLLGATGRRLRESAELLRRTATRDVNEIEEDHRTTVMRVADLISEFSGSLPFLFIHCFIFFVWIILSVGPLAETRFGALGPLSFGLLTMVVSLEDDHPVGLRPSLAEPAGRAATACATTSSTTLNLKAELEVAELHKKLDYMSEQILALARATRASAPVGRRLPSTEGRRRASGAAT